MQNRIKKEMNLYYFGIYNKETDELILPFKEYLQKYKQVEDESEKARDKRIKRIINIREHLRHLKIRKGSYYIPPIVKHYRCANIDEIDKFGILKIKEGKNLIRIAFITYKDKIIVFDAFDKPEKYEKKLKRKIKKIEKEFIEKIENYITYYLKNKYAILMEL